ncbi:PREDICTED: transcriptional regulator ATRX homolog [Cyphomyrmex costatus]|uniref:transcriptional regulator ATRX homolog n=1 Tax=Cyphomyrmex costatus TaxID=456900 RepID=UPI000852375E|nr:PREDICTED: transcriptional regulator ATRX homolog [Cyphomyrmex costatus]
MDSVPKKGNKKRSNKIEKRILPYEMQRIDKTRNIQKNLKTFCDKEDDESSEKLFVSARFTQKHHRTNNVSLQKRRIVDPTDSSSEDSFYTNENLSSSSKRNKQNKNESDRKVKSVRNVYSLRKVSRSVVKGENILKNNKIFSDSNNDSSDTSSNKTKKHTIKHNRSEKILKPKTNNCSSDSENDENDTNITLSVSKRTSKDTRQQNKKMNNSYNARSRDKAKKYDSTSESEDEKHIKQYRRKRSETSQSISHINEERKRDKSSKQQLFNIQEDDSDNSSSKEFKTIKLHKVKHKYSMRQLADLDVDYTRTPKNFANDKSDKINEQSKQNFNDMEKIVTDCKEMCSNFQMYIESIERLHGKGDEEKLILRSIEKIDKLRMTLKEKSKSLTTSYQSWSRNRKKSTAKRLNKVSDNKIANSSEESSSEEHEKRIEDEDKHVFDNKQSGNKAVSECDSEEIFSTDETRSPEKIVSSAKTEKGINNNETNINDEDGMSIDKSKNNDKHNVEVQDDSPELNLKKKISMERSSKKQLFSECNKSNDKTKPLNKNESEIEDSPSRNSGSNMALENDRINQSIKNIINESSDMFDTSLEDAEKSTAEIETNCSKEELLQTFKDNILNHHKNSLQSEVSNEKERIFLKKKDLSNQDNQENAISVIKEVNNDLTPSRKTNTDDNDSTPSRKTNTDDNDSVDDAETLAKKALLATDSDTLDNENYITNTAKSTKVLFTDDTNQIERKHELEDNDSDVNSVSTIVLPTYTKDANINSEKTVDTETEIEANGKSDDQPDRKSHKEISSSKDENDRANKAAKISLLESNSDDSTLLSLESEKFTNKKSESDSSKKNAEAKLSLLASSSENSNSEPTSSEMTNVSKNIKRNRELESDEEHFVTRSKKKRFKLDENHHYKNNKKLRMSCKVYLVRLSTEILKRHSDTLKKSRERLERKELESLLNLDKLEKSSKKNTKKDSDSLTDNDSSSKVLKNSNKKKKTKEKSLMDYLDKIENEDAIETASVDMNFDTEELVHQMNVDDVTISNEALISEADRIAKENLLNSSDSVDKEVDSDCSIKNDDIREKEENKKKKYREKSEDKTSKNDKKDKSDWRRDTILRTVFSDSDSDAEREKWEKKQEKIENKSKGNNDSDDKAKLVKSKKKKRMSGRRIIDSDSDVKIMDVDSDSSSEISSVQNSSESDNTKKEKKKLKWIKRRKRSNSSDTDSSLAEKPKPKRKRIKKMASDSDSSDVEVINSQGSTPGQSGRKNIRKVLKDKQVAEDTKLAAKEEEERLKRIADRQALYNEMFEMRLAGEEKVDKLVLDFDTETKQELITVHKELVKHLKPHQAQGIKFMWDACFESLERVDTTSGSGCIIAHCMGLGKTLQVITLTHTLLTHDATKIKTVLVVCPLSTVLNWKNEYNTWLKDLDDIEVYELTKFKKNFERKYQLQRWQNTGGVMIIGYEMFRNLTGPNKNIRKSMKEIMLECLVDPGADLIVCDEGHLLKNEDTALSKCMRSVKTMRRIVLTGTPLQNNLIEYHCMVQFVKPNLLGTKKEFSNRFVNPITNGQCVDSTAFDVNLMKKRAHVLHKMLEGSVQRFDYSVLTPFLPPKQEYVIFVRLTDIQIKMYQYYLENFAKRQFGSGRSHLFADFQALQRIWTHPIVLRLNAEKIEKANEKKELSSDSAGSLKDFVVDGTTDEESTSSNDSSDDSDVQAIDDKKDEKEQTSVFKRKTRNNPIEEESTEQIKENPETESLTDWWLQFVQPEHFDDVRTSAKLLLLFEILKECEQIGDKVLVFSQSLYSLTLIEEFLRKIDDQTQNGASCDTLDNHTGSWSLGLDYFRLDGQTSPENRNMWCKIFNRPTNMRARLFLISTRAGGLGINLTAANRVIIFDASWNPSHDVQSIFRVYRFGQKKPCYVYRFLAAGTMEEKIYNRQVTKLSLSCRVIDEQQIERHYSNHNLNELYTFEGYDKEKPTLNLPKDRLLAEIFLKFKDVVENYHEHDSLLENKAEEELDEEERKQAWLEYEEEKKGKPVIHPMMNPIIVNQNNAFLQQLIMMRNSIQSNMLSQNVLNEYENLQQLIRKDYPNASPEQQKMITNRAFTEMYDYWEKQATLGNNQPVQLIQNPILPNFQQRPQAPNFQQRPQIPATSNLHINQVSQLNQLLSGQSMNYMNSQHPAQLSDAQKGVVLPNLFIKQSISSNNNRSGIADQDVEIPTTSNTGTTRQSEMSSVQIAAQSSDNSKIQEE